jgi:hypothetical protein
MDNKQYIGCDPGKTGQVVMIQNGFSKLHITKFKFPMIGNEYDMQGMLNIFRKFRSDNCHIVIEDVKALQKPMQAGNWSLSEGKTILVMSCVALDLPYTLVHSKTWQKEIWQGVKVQQISTGKKLKSGAMKMKTLTKETSLLAIKRLFPSVDLREDVEAKYYANTSTNKKLGRVGERVPRKAEKPHDGVVDALAMAEYCRRKFK